MIIFIWVQMVDEQVMYPSELKKLASIDIDVVLMRHHISNKEPSVGKNN